MIAAPYSAGELVVLVGAITSGACAVIGAVFAGMAAIRVKRVDAVASKIHEEVRTINGMALGQLADAAETRRIDHIDPPDRTRGEADHMATVESAATRPFDIRDKPLGE